jgi:integrase
MFRKLGRTSTPGVFRWKIWMRMPGGIIHRHVELTEPQAMRLYADMCDEKARAVAGIANPTSSQAQTLGAAANRYSSELVRSGYNADHSTQVSRTLASLLATIPPHTLLASIGRSQIMQWRDAVAGKAYRGHTPCPRTVNKGLAHLSAFFAWCCREGWCDRNPAQYAGRIKEITPPLRPLPWPSFRRFADTAWEVRQDFALLVEVLGETGARLGEAIRARVGDVDQTGRVWAKIVKPGRVAQVDAGPWVLYAAAGRDAGELLCPCGSGEPWHEAMVRGLFERVREIACVPERMTPHWIRHGRACWDLADGASIWSVKTKLAHSTVMVTERYARAAELLRRSEVASGAVESHTRTPPSSLGPCCGVLRGGPKSPRYVAKLRQSAQSQKRT